MTLRISEPITERPDATWTCEQIGSWVLQASEVATARHLIDRARLAARIGPLQAAGALSMDAEA